MVVEKIAPMENLANPFMKTLSTRVSDDHRDSLSLICVPNIP